MNTDRDRRLQENEERARSIKEDLIAFREAMLRSENALNVLAIERTNLECAPGEEHLEIPQELQAFIPTNLAAKSRRIWSKALVGGAVLVALLLGLGGLGIFNNDGSAPVAHRAVLPTPHVVDPSAKKGNEESIDTLSSTHPSIVANSSATANSTSDKIHNAPNEVSINILPGITYISEISYSMRSSAITMVEVSDTPQITLHLNHAPQSFFIPMRTPFRIDSEGIDRQSGALMVFADSKKHDLEIRFEPRRLPPESKILDVSSSQ